ncbi:MAG: hypothetical protein WA126_14905 [Thermodesulfovibrionales bacterium]
MSAKFGAKPFLPGGTDMGMAALAAPVLEEVETVTFRGLMTSAEEGNSSGVALAVAAVKDEVSFSAGRLKSLSGGNGMDGSGEPEFPGGFSGGI